MRNKKLILSLFWLLGACVALPAQEDYWEESPEERYLQEPIEVNAFDRAEWERLKKEMAYKTERESAEEQLPEEEIYGQGGEEETRGRSGISFGGGVLAAVAKIILFVALAIGIALIVRYLLGYTRPKNKRLVETGEVSETDLEKIEENLHETDLDRYIRRALEQKQYTLAIRLYYLAILKNLSLERRIRWKRDKTNRDYLLEMQSSPAFSEFNALTAIFERVWYGGKTIDEHTFRQLEPRYRKFIAQIGTLART